MRHSSVGASGAHRWLSCPGSVAASASLGDKGDDDNVYAREGQAAHALADQVLRGNYAERYLDMWWHPILGSFTDKSTHPQAVHIDEEMVEHVESYRAYVRGLYDPEEKPYPLWIESTADLSMFHPDMFGTSDAIVYQADTCTMHVIDLKYGQGYPVEAVDNAQLKFYGVAALMKISKSFPIENVVLTIVQPRARHHDGPIRHDKSQTPLSLLEFGFQLADGAKLALGQGAPLKAGSWCKWCKALADCQEAQRHSLEMAKEVFDDEDAVRIGELMMEAFVVEEWIRAVRAAGLRLLKLGRPPAGWEIGESKTHRKWSHSEKSIVGALKKRFSLTDHDLYTTPTLKTPRQIELQLPKDDRKIMAKLASRPKGSPVLVRAGSAGPVTTGAHVFDEE